MKMVVLLLLMMNERPGYVHSLPLSLVAVERRGPVSMCLYNTISAKRQRSLRWTCTQNLVFYHTPEFGVFGLGVGGMEGFVCRACFLILYFYLLQKPRVRMFTARL